MITWTRGRPSVDPFWRDKLSARLRYLKLALRGGPLRWQRFKRAVLPFHHYGCPCYACYV